MSTAWLWAPTTIAAASHFAEGDSSYVEGEANLQSFNTGSNFTIGWTNQTVSGFTQPTITISQYGAEVDFTDTRNLQSLSATTTSVFEDADIARQLATAAILDGANKAWNGTTSTFTDNSGYMSYKLSFDLR